jgi:hypothetical protein
MSIREPESLTPVVGANSSASVKLKIVAAAPMPSARDSTDVIAKTGLRPRRRTE